MGDVKNVMSYFCKYLNLLLDWDTDDLEFKPEFIRLAKHNKTDNNVVFQFWLLLSKLDYMDLKFKNDVTMVERVKLNFAYYNYKGVDFYALPDDFKHGSRELLLALTWLISNTNILSKLVEIKLANSSINYEFPDQYSDVSIPEKLTFSEERDTINYMSLLIGKINSNLRIKDDCSRKLKENMNKIHRATKYDVDIPHLSVNDVYVSKDAELQNHFVNKNAMVISLLEAKTKWEESQGIFWKWMLTVLNEKINDKTVHPPKETLVLSNFVELLKKEIHTKPNTSNEKKNTLSESQNGNDAQTESNASPLPRHVYVSNKGSKASQTGPFNSLVLAETENKTESNSNYKTAEACDRLAKQISEKLSFILTDKNLNSR